MSDDFWYSMSILISLLSISIIVRLGLKGNFKKRNPHVEFKCLEHMAPLDKWTMVTHDYGYWACPHEGCEAGVDAESRWLYEGVRPPT